LKTTPEVKRVLSVELHTHSALSYDGRDPVDLLLEQAAAVGLDALAVTDHDGSTPASRRPRRPPTTGSSASLAWR